jgi:hypothetical protein
MQCLRSHRLYLHVVDRGCKSLVLFRIGLGPTLAIVGSQPYGGFGLLLGVWHLAQLADSGRSVSLSALLERSGGAERGSGCRLTVAYDSSPWCGRSSC